MKRLAPVTAVLALVAALGGVMGVDSAAAKATYPVHGGVGLVNPCNGETVAGTGPTKIVFVERKGGFVVHWTFKVKTTGSLGNRYALSFVANGQFAAPTGSGPGFTFFDVPVHSEVISLGGAPNFSLELGIRVFVAGGAATGSLFIGPSSTTCHG